MIRRAFTLIEVMIVTGILAVLILAVLVSLNGQRPKAEDSRVKSQLDRLKIAFEDYYNDNNCYPPAEWFDAVDDCGAGHLKPYLGAIPCDPKNGEPYKLEFVNGQCGGFRLYGNLSITTDPDAFSPYTYSGQTYNYAVSSSNVTNDPTGGNGGTPTLPPGHNYYWCSAVNNCTRFFPEDGEYCTPYYTDEPNCDGTADAKCSSVGSCTAN